MEEPERRFAMTARLFRAPFSVHILLLAFAAWSLFRLGVSLLGYALDRERLFARFTSDLIRRLVPAAGLVGEPPVHVLGPLEPWLFLLILAFAFVLWAFFGVAIARAVAVRIARDEHLSFVGALRFSWRTRRSSLVYPALLFVVLFFLLIANGVTGLLAGIPAVGPVLLVPLFPLVLVVTLIFTLVAVGGLLGIGLTTGALATERNGTLDAVSRTYGYLFSQPLYFVFATALALLFAKILLWVGHDLFLDTAVRSLGFLHESATLEETLDVAVRGIRGFDRLSPPEWIGAAFLWSVVSLLRLAISSLVIAYLVSASTYVYFILREEVDGIPFTDIDLGLRADEPIEPPVGTGGEGSAGVDPAPGSSPGGPHGDASQDRGPAAPGSGPRPSENWI